MKYTSLFLDLDNTLLDFTKAEAVAIRKVLKNHGLPYDDATIKMYSEINLSFWKRFEKGEIKKQEIFEGRFKALLEAINATGDTAAISKDYFENLSCGYYTVEGAFSVLDYLKSKGYKLYATTNGVSFTQYRRVKESGIEPYFDGVFVSEDAGSQKPEKEYFDYVISNIPEKDRRKILVIGDSQTSDILGAINSELDSCWYNPHGCNAQYNATYEIKDLTELKKML